MGWTKEERTGFKAHFHCLEEAAGSHPDPQTKKDELLQVTGGEDVCEVDRAETQRPRILCVKPKPSTCRGLINVLLLMSSAHSNLCPDQLARAVVGVGWWEERSDASSHAEQELLFSYRK